MGFKVEVKGVRQVQQNLNKEIAAIKGRTVGGLLAAGLIIQADAQRRVPVEYGKLRQFAFTRKAQNNPQAVEVGFSADYAVYVHENLQQKLKGKPRPSGLGVYWGPQGEPKFLERAANAKRDEVVDAVRKHAAQRGRAR